MKTISKDINGNYLRKTTVGGLWPLLLAQILIALFCVPETLQGGTEIRREVPWEELHELLSGEEKVTVLLSPGGAVRSNRVTVLHRQHSSGLHHKVHGLEAIPLGIRNLYRQRLRQGIRLENMRGYARVGGAIQGAAGAFGLTLLVAHGSNWYLDGRHGDLLAATAVGAPIAGAVLGYWLGQRSDRETTIIKIVD